MSTDLTTQHDSGVSLAGSEGIAKLMQTALEHDKVEALERLAALYERAEDRAAEREFNAALHRFQIECPPIRKSKTVDETTRAGNRLHYSYAPLEEICRTIRDPLHANGFTYTWDSETTDTRVVVRCTLRHNAGHSATASFSAVAEGTRAMSGSQKASGALTVARRQSLVQVLGLTQVDTDTDDRGIPNAGETISDSQAADLREGIQEAGGDIAKFCTAFRIERIEDLPVVELGRAGAAIERVRKANR